MQTINYETNIAKNTFISNYPDIREFFIDNIQEVNILNNIIFDYLPIYHKWCFSLTTRKGCLICSFNISFYASSIIECWTNLKTFLKKKHYELISFNEFKTYIYKEDDVLYVKYDKPFVEYAEVIIIPIIRPANERLFFDISHHKYYNKIHNEKELKEILNNYNSFYFTNRVAYYNKITGIIDNIDTKQTIRNIDINKIDPNDYIVIGYLNMKIKRCIHIGSLFKNAHIKKNKLYFASGKGNRKYNTYPYCESLNIKYIDTKNKN